MAREIQRFQVAIKAFVLERGRLLVLRERAGVGLWEIPGGRVEVGEEAFAHEDVLRRELAEELGSAFSCRIGAPCVTWVRPVEPHRQSFTFLVGLECTEPRGEIRLSDEHRELRWVADDEWRSLELAPGYAGAFENFWRRQRGANVEEKA
jgi:8-oxo-dGTP pyrophosphatase MutT (NUDIX family)